VQYWTNDDGVPQPYESRMTTHVTVTDYNSEMTIELPEEYRDRATPTPDLESVLDRPIRHSLGPIIVEEPIHSAFPVTPTPTPHVIVWTFPDEGGEY
jgi:hypothetical protein